MIAEGSSKLASVPSGGAAPAASSGGAAAAAGGASEPAAEEKKEEAKEGESSTPIDWNVDLAQRGRGLLITFGMAFFP